MRLAVKHKNNLSFSILQLTTTSLSKQYLVWTVRNLIITYCMCFSGFSNAQETLSELLKKLNNQSIPYITVQELAMPKTNAILLDAREKNEFDVSHLKNATHIGYDKFQLKTVLNLVKDKATKIVVYCTLGVRSEDIAEQLKSNGYTNVYNLYGGIIEWKNKAFNVYNKKEVKTNNVHVCNAYWGKWLTKGEKIYD